MAFFGIYGGDLGAYDVGSPSPGAGFTGAPVTGMQPLTVNFADASTGSPTGWIWSFGDGLTGADQNPTHTYTGVGSYTVSLEVWASGGTGIATAPNYITVSASPLDADFFAVPTSGDTPLPVVFANTSTHTAPILSWLWTFGDGYTSADENPVHTYTHPGTYTVTLTATTAYASDTETKVFYIAVTQAPVVLKTLDTAAPESLPLLRVMPATGDGNQSTLLKGVRYSKSNSADSNGSGFKRPNGPLLTFD